ncbi:MAG: DedA family protein [Calditrichaeota bacterium]|nr:DedA family protein [Calditrichota bacterium]
MEHWLAIFHQQSGVVSYILLFFVGFLENVFPPVPGDTVIVLSLLLIEKGWLNFWIVLICVSVGGTLGFYLVFYLAFRWGKAWVLRQRWLHLNAKRLDKVDRWFERHGSWLVLGHRFFSGFRSTIALIAGLSSIEIWKMAILSFLGVTLWNTMLLAVGLEILKNKAALLHILKTYNLIVGSLVLLGIGVGIVFYRIKQKARSSQS